jgi:4a-hydroxytetrahydrobiopterin dehydratase
MNEKMLSMLSCEQDVSKLAPVEGKELARYLKILNGWREVGKKHIVKEFDFADFLASWRFASKVAEIAEREGHHPRICVDYGQVTIILATHSLDAITKNDLIIAAKIDLIKN